MSTHIKNTFLTALAVGAVVLLASLAFWAVSVRANPSFIVPQAATATATTSPTYLIPGTSTSTVTFDTYGVCGTNQTDTGEKSIPSQVALNLQLAASSSATTYNFAVEYSNDCVDWYQNNTGNVLGFNIASTSNTVGNTISVNNVQNFSYDFASTTVGGIAVTNANSATTTKTVVLPMPYRAIRVVSSLKASGTRGALWASLIPLRQVK